MEQEMRHNPKPQEVYRHFKGNLYQILCLAKDSENGETMVVYQAMYGDFQIYVRPLSSFMEEIDRKKYPDAENADPQEELNIDPLVLQFLDADSYERRLEILSMLHNRIDHDMINTMAVAVDVEIKDGELEDRYEELKGCLLTFERFECNRLR